MLGVGRDDGVSFDALFLEKETEAVWRARWGGTFGLVTAEMWEVG